MPANNRELRCLKARELRVAKNADGSRTITGVVCYNSLSLDLGGWREIIAPGAFADSLDDVLLLRDHKPVLLMGRSKSGTLKLEDKADGLHFSCNLPDTEAARSLAESIDRGDLDGVSFGFSIDNYETDVQWAVTNEEAVRTVLKAHLWEISPCSWAAYPENSVSSRSLHSCPKDIRARIERRNADCQCTCQECQDGDCENCSNPDCDDPNCEGSERSKPPATPPAPAELPDSERHRMHMTLELRKRK